MAGACSHESHETASVSGVSRRCLRGGWANRIVSMGVHWAMNHE
ncbi:hypothetical protein RRSWK_06060 [Rhodopirellula sp. SWK7]|nr:hypothetical protein RRSWK_06060 [Rhodopirellula sp. SWK7]